MKNKNILNYNVKYSGLIIFVAGAIASFGFAPFHFFPLTILSYVFLIHFFIISQKEKKNVFLCSFFYGLGTHIGLLYWIAISFQTANSGGYLLGAVAVFILCSFLSIFIAIPFYLLIKFSKNFKDINFGLFFIFIFTIFDWLKGNILWSFPWTPISSIWAFSSFTLYPFSVLGVWGYSFITYSLIISFYYFIFNFKKGLIFLIPFILIILVMPNLLKKEKSFFDTIFIRVVQPNIKQEEKWNKEYLFNNYQKLTSLIKSSGYKEIDLLILPETAINFKAEELNNNDHKNNFGLDYIKNIIIGSIRTSKEGRDIKIFNSMYLITSNTKNNLYHDKLKLVPFGEYIPFRRIINVKKLTSGSIDFTKGDNPKTFAISPKIKILPLICYEVIFPNLISSLKSNYNLIVNITNDAWYKKSSGPYQHLSHSRIRAVMEGVTLIRAANTGISGVIGPNGKILKKLGLGQAGIIDYRLNVNSIKTVYSVYRDKVFYLIMLTLFALICISFFYNNKQVK